MHAAILLWAGLLAAQPAANASDETELMKQVQAAVERLSSDRSADREAAEKDLVALGPSALPHLPETSARTPAELRIRLTRVRNALVKAEVEAATRPSLVTLTGKMPASEALAEIAKQTGNRLVDYRERFNQEATDPVVEVNLQAVPFWQALDTVLDAAQLTIYNYDEERGALAYTSRGAEAAQRAGRGSYGGLFRLEPTRIEATRDLRNSSLHGMKLFVDAVWEPRIRPIVLEVPLAGLSAEDESGSAIAVDRAEGTLEVPVEGASAGVELEIPLNAPPRSVKQLATLRGQVTAVVLGKPESFEFANVDQLRSMELERGGATVTVESCRKNGDIYDVSLRVRFDQAANALESHRGWIYENESYLIDPQGKRIRSEDLEATLLERNEVGISYKFDLGDQTPAGYTFLYRTPAAVIRIPVAIEIKNIDLP